MHSDLTVTRDGPGWRAEVDLAPGAEATAVLTSSHCTRQSAGSPDHDQGGSVTVAPVEEPWVLGHQLRVLNRCRTPRSRQPGTPCRSQTSGAPTPT
ncbi:hypothetical protein FNH04_08455 [Streptomyces phyllanthi]|uniref:Uncharacterized protein n=1 Tax=Streptomyces phyllanthi TaxID=1803180 RepID=A0A5N8W0T2_9ACTN|nr:hypothetical protein [Streptomyces phyllanthi]